jgi:glutamate carboxypeptidase
MSGKCKELFAIIDSLYDEYMKVWADVCSIESPTSDKAGVDAVGKYLSDLARSLGFSVNTYPEPVSGDFIEIIMNPEAKGRPVCTSAHLDTVFPKGVFGYPPVRTDEEKIYGPGVVDCKGGAVAALMAMDALATVGFTARPVKLLLQTDEEINSSTSEGRTVRRMCELSADAEAFLNCEGHKGRATVARKGILTYNFKVRGVACHSARCYEGKNAITEAAHKIIEIERWKEKDGITCNVAIIGAGTVVNVVPDECSFSVNVRYPDDQSRELIDRTLREIAARSYIGDTTCEVVCNAGRPAMEYVPRNVELLRRMNEIYESEGLPVLQENHEHGGSDTAYTTAYGIPSIDSLGTQGGSIHSTGEFAYKRSLLEAAKRIASVIYCL